MKLVFLVFVLALVSADFKDELEELRRTLLEEVKKELLKEELQRRHVAGTEIKTKELEEDKKENHEDEKKSIIPGAFDESQLNKRIQSQDKKVKHEEEKKSIIPGAFDEKKSIIPGAFNEKKSIIPGVFNELDKKFLGAGIFDENQMNKRVASQDVFEKITAVKKEHENKKKELEKRLYESMQEIKKKVLEENIKEFVEAVKKEQEIKKKEIVKRMSDMAEAVKKAGEIKKKELINKVSESVAAAKKTEETQKKEIEQNLREMVNTVQKRSQSKREHYQRRGWCKKQVGESCGKINCCAVGHCYFGDEGWAPWRATGTCRECFGFERTCTKDSPCCDGLQCDRQEVLQFRGVCKPFRIEGEPCIEDEQCVANHFCKGFGKGTCMREYSLPSNASCKSDLECNSRICTKSFGETVSFKAGTCQ